MHWPRNGNSLTACYCRYLLKYEEISSHVLVRPSPFPSPNSKEPSENTLLEEPPESGTAFSTRKDSLRPSTPPTTSGETSGYDSMAEKLEYRPTEKAPLLSIDHSNLHVVVTELTDCNRYWYLLAILLGVPKTRAAQILAFSINNPRRGLIEAMSYWLDNSSNASWSAIVKALYVLERKNKAKELAEKYSKYLIVEK